MKKFFSALFILIIVFHIYTAAYADGDITVISPPAETGSIEIIGNNGSQKTMQANPNKDNGYEFSYWSYTVSDNSTKTSTKNPIDFDIYERTVTCVFSKIHYEVTVNSTIGGTASGGGTYEHGSTITLTATPNIGYVFACWKNGDTILSSSPTWTTSAVGNLTYTAVFTGQMNTITAFPDPVGAGLIDDQPSFSETFNYAEHPTITLNATPITGYVFDGWYENGSKVSSVASAAFETSRSREIVAKFISESTPETVDPASPDMTTPITVVPESTGKIIITYMPDSNSTPTTPFQIEWYAGNVFIAGQYYSRTGYTQTGWSTSAGGPKTYNLNATTFLNDNLILYPYWESASLPLYLTVNIGSGGSVQLHGNGNIWNGWSGKLEPKQAYTFYFHPNPGNYVYRIALAGWHYPVQSGNSFTVTYEMLAGKNQTLQILFADARSHPPTGDNSQMSLWATLGAMSLTALLVLIAARKKKQ